MQKEVRVNRRIRAPEIRLIDADGGQLGVYITVKALELAENQGLDLVEISPTSKPPVCKIMDYGKYKYQQTKKIKESKKHQSVVVLKEIKFRPNTDDHDLDFKIRNIIRFLDEGHKVKSTVVFRGREMAYREGGKKILDYVLEQTKEKGVLEVPPKMEGRQMMMILTPVKTLKPGGKPEGAKAAKKPDAAKPAVKPEANKASAPAPAAAPAPSKP